MPDSFAPAAFDASLDRYAAAFEASRDRVHALADGLSDAAFNWKQLPGAWSIGECLVHLHVIAVAYEPYFAEAFATAPARPVRPAPLRPGLLGALFVASVRPGSPRIPTFPAMKPPPTDGQRSHIDRREALAAFDADTDALVHAVEQARATDAGRVRVREPFLPQVRLPLVAFLDGLGQHALRHTAQAERVATAPGFPG